LFKHGRHDKKKTGGCQQLPAGFLFPANTYIAVQPEKASEVTELVGEAKVAFVPTSLNQTAVES
jgi:hypothetical protein